MLERVHGNRLAAARILRVSYKTMLNKITEYGLTRTSGRARASVGVASTSAAVLPVSPPGSHAGASLDAK